MLFGFLGSAVVSVVALKQSAQLKLRALEQGSSRRASCAEGK